MELFADIDLSHNWIPKSVHRIHLIAVCGSAMGALAAMLKEKGYGVSGSDEGVYPPMSDFLREKGVRLIRGFDRGNLEDRPDLVIVGNAVRRENPEARAMVEMGLNFCSMPQAINHFFAQDKQTVVVTGTHGKTTTASLLAWILAVAGKEPSFVIGGIVKDFNSNYQLGAGPHLVLEGDEYDTAFFDKGPKFLHYPPHAAILTGVEYDHADIYADLAHVKSAFADFIRRLAPSVPLLAYDRDENVSELVKSAPCRVLRYGLKKDSHWRLAKVRVAPPFSWFQLFRTGEFYGEFKARLMGEHNLLNAVADIAVADYLGISPAFVAEALKRFAGVRRRQEVRGVKKGITVMDDFAHHPTAVRETLRAVRPFFPGGRILAVFEPRTNTSMRQVFQAIYPACFDQADIVCIRKPSRLDKVPENERFCSEKLVADIAGQGIPAFHFDETGPIIDFLRQTARFGDLVLIMSNGGFDNIHERLLAAL